MRGVYCWSVTTPTRGKMEDLSKAIADRKNPTLTQTQKKSLSEQIGVLSAHKEMLEQGYTRLEHQLNFGSNAKQGQFDCIYWNGDQANPKVFVIEAKGGDGILTSREIKFGELQGKRAQQGTIQYRDDIIANMKESGTNSGIEEAWKLIEQAIVKENLSSRYASSIGLFFEALPELKKDYYSRNAIAIFLSCKEAVSYTIVLHLDKSETYQALFYMSQFGVNHFKLSVYPNLERDIPVGESFIKTKGKVTRDYISHGTWMQVFYAAAILRDKTAIHYLANIENGFMEQGNVSFDDVRIAEVNVYKVLYENTEYLARAIELYESAEKKFSKKDPSRAWIDSQGTPVILLAKAVLHNNSEEFNTLLEDALKRHYKHYSQKGQAGYAGGWVSLPLLMICSYAYDRGIVIQVESDYIPRWIIEGDFKDCELSIK